MCFPINLGQPCNVALKCRELELAFAIRSIMFLLVFFVSVRFQCRYRVLLFRIVYLYFVLRRNEGLMDQFAACIRAIRFIFFVPFFSFFHSFFFYSEVALVPPSSSLFLTLICVTKTLEIRLGTATATATATAFATAAWTRRTLSMTQKNWITTGWTIYRHGIGSTDEKQKKLVWRIKVGSILFLGATKHRYNWLCPLVGWSVCLSVCNAFVRGSTRCTLLAYLALFFVSCQDLHHLRALILILLFLRNSIRRKRFLLCF